MKEMKRIFLTLALVLGLTVVVTFCLLALIAPSEESTQAVAGGRLSFVGPSAAEERDDDVKPRPSRLPRISSNPLHETIDIALMEEIDEKMKQSDLAHPPAGTEPNPFARRIPFAHVPIGSRGLQRRLLAESNSLTQPGIITFDGQTSSTAEYYAYKYIFTNLKEYSTQFVIYPYNFTYSPNASEPSLDVSFKRGGVFTLKPHLLPSDESSYNYFKSLKAQTDVKFGKAKALYDISVAVVRIEDFFEDIYKELTYESSNYCNLLSTYLGKYKDCMTGADYLKFKGDAANAGKTTFVYLSEDDIVTKDLLLTSDGAPRFRLLIIPDYYAGAHSVISSKLGTTGLQKIRDFVAKGGLIYASGKAGYLLELWKILPTGLYDTNQFLTSTHNDQVVTLNACDPEEPDFMKRLLCMNLTIDGTTVKSFLLSAYLINSAKLGNMTVVMSYNNNSASLMKKDLDGLTSGLTTSEKLLLPFAMLGSYGKGKVYVVNGNPLFKSWYNNLFYNFLFMAMSKNVVFDAYVGTKDNKPIPGGEAGIQLDVNLMFINLFDTPVNNLAMHVWFPNGVVPSQMPSTCVPDTTNMSLVVDLSAVNCSSHLKCGQDVLGAFEKYEGLINVEIISHTVTQAKLDILMVLPAVVYTESETGVTYRYDAGGIRTSASLAALLRGALNPDPSSFYPVLGRGQYVDNVLQVENKEDTTATNVIYYGMVPLVSPLVDGSDQTEVIRVARFLASYYTTNHTYYYPFKSEVDKNYDYVDYAWLNGKDIVIDLEWDIPVKALKVPRDSTFPVLGTTGSYDIKNMNQTTMIDSKHMVLKQVYYINADKYFEHATQRQMVFVDTTKPAGAQVFYPNGIPDGEKNPNNPTVAKQELLWTRSDLYFYSAKDYQMPENIDDTHVVSIDRYPNSSTGCVNTFGDARAKIEVKGYFDIAYPDGLKANEYSNELLMYCGKKKYGLDEIAAASNGSIRPIHYLVPVKNDAIQRADDIMHFIVDTDGTGYLQDYPEVRFIYAHYFNILVDGSITRQGGRLEIQLPEGVSFINEAERDPVANYFVSYSADQVAFYKTVYNATSRLITGYFKRGLMPNEAYGKPSLLGITVEQLTSSVNVEVTLRIYEMKYDISSPSTQFERYMLRQEKSIFLMRDRFYSLPAVEVRVKVQRTNQAIMPYELMEPYTRFGVYIQELQKHRTVWATPESHHVRDPGVQSLNGGFAMISNLGISSIPFVEYVTTGKALLIPNSPSTSRVEWEDIWGRRWVQPLRSVFPDVPPVPPPLRNFMMSTTFELFKTGTTERVLEWSSDEVLDIRVQIKLLNNYPKYFLITTCKENDVAFFQEKQIQWERSRIFEPLPLDYQITLADAPNSSYHINLGGRSVYGMCFGQEGTILEGNTLDAATRATISTAYLCSATLDAAKMLECDKQLANLPTVKRRPTGNTYPNWTYSPSVAAYYPRNYIKGNMWDLTHYDYDDNAMDKAYKYHMDNTLPGMDFGPLWNPPYYKPHNLIAQPIFKGFGYQITYNKAKTLKKFPKYQGWWSDNLQNKDNTLYAGQAQSNDISVDKETLLPPSAWINARELINPKTRAVINTRLKNIHTCLYNQHRVRLMVNQPIGAYLGNVYQNNIIPILPDLEKDDPRLNNFDCTNVYQYSPYNISQADNVLTTPTIRDWLYFSANLRGGALENINIPFTLAPISSTRYEGLAKVQDGGRFVYWNPANGPNSFLIVDNPVNVVEAKRCDLSITVEVVPKTTTTFGSVLYHLFTVSDPAENMRQWKYETYTNNYGFGDSTVALFVGGTLGTKAIVDVGQTTYIKITFYNNAGFDWNMYGSAIDFQYLGSQPINANDLLFRLKHAIQLPLKYNFMIMTIPDELKPYIKIEPSDHNIDVAPQFFDFMNINVVTIRDGFKGDYYYKMQVLSGIPDSLRGRVHEIKLEVNETCFDRLPGYNDSTGSFHDYHLKIPPIKFGIPYGSGEHAGKVFYTSGYSKDLLISSLIPNYWNIEEARLVTDAQIGLLRVAAGDTEHYNKKLLEVWETIPATTPLPITLTASGTNNKVTINMAHAFPTLPLKNGNNPDIAGFNVLLKCNASQLAYGLIRVISNSAVTYKDFNGKTKSATIAEPLDKLVTSKGAWLQVTYSSMIMQMDTQGKWTQAKDQRFFVGDVRGVVKTQIYTKNVGTDTAFGVNFTLVLADGVGVIRDMLPYGMNYSLTPQGSDTVMRLNQSRSFAAGDSYSEVVYLSFESLKRRLLAATTSRTFIKGVGAEIFLTAGQSIPISQSISTPLKFSVITADRDTVTLDVTTEFVNFKPIFHVTAIGKPTTTSSGKNIRYLITRQIIGLDCEDDAASPSTGSCTTINRNLYTVKALSESNTVDDKPIPDSFTGIVRSGLYEYKVETYSETKALLASSLWRGVAERPALQASPNNPASSSENGNKPKGEENPGDPSGPQDNPEQKDSNGTSSLVGGNLLGSYSLPMWAIVLIPTAAFAIVLLAAILIYRRYRHVKVHNESTSQEVAIRVDTPAVQ